MADYWSFADGIPLSDPESSDSEEELNVAELTLEEEPEVQFNNPNIAAESLATTPIPTSEASKKWPWDIARIPRLKIEVVSCDLMRGHH